MIISCGARLSRLTQRVVRQAPLLLALALIVACGRERDSAFSQQPTPDLAVTTLEAPDIERVAIAMQLQGLIQLGGEMTTDRSLSEPVRSLLEVIRDQQISRGRDLDALVRLKHAPAPDHLGKEHSRWLEELRAATDASMPRAVLRFHQAVHKEFFRLMRETADESTDVDARAFAQRRLPGITSTLRLITQVSDQTP